VLQRLGLYSYRVYVSHVPIYGALERAGFGAVTWIAWTGNVWAGQRAFIATAGGPSRWAGRPELAMRFGR
jgi:hypothetical protein